MVIRSILCVLALFSGAVLAQEAPIDLTAIGKKYFAAWAATQAPKASAQDVDRYLSLLTDDVGHQHLPYDVDDHRDVEGKKRMREGMMYYLGGHTDYNAELTSIVVGYNVIIIQYDTQAKGIHPQTQEMMTLSYQTTEVLEVEQGKISVIRKYSE